MIIESLPKATDNTSVTGQSSYGAGIYNKFFHICLPSSCVINHLKNEKQIKECTMKYINLLVKTYNSKKTVIIESQNKTQQNSL